MNCAGLDEDGTARAATRPNITTWGLPVRIRTEWGDRLVRVALRATPCCDDLAGCIKAQCAPCRYLHRTARSTRLLIGGARTRGAELARTRAAAAEGHDHLVAGRRTGRAARAGTAIATSAAGGAISTSACPPSSGRLRCSVSRGARRVVRGAGAGAGHLAHRADRQRAA